jgi:dihydrolipoamide dehydrogenase
MGLEAKDIAVDLGKAYAWKDRVVHKLESGIRVLCNGNGVQLMEGFCTLQSSSTAAVEGPAGTQHIEFKRAVIATGTHYRELEGLPFDGKLVINPDHVLLFDHVPDEMIIIGGGYAGITMAAMIAAMGTKLVLIHKDEKILPFLDDDVLKPVMDQFREKGVKVISRATWTVKKSADKVHVDVEHEGKKESFETAKLLVATGIKGNTESIGLENTKVKIDEKGYIVTDKEYRTDDPSIYAIGDIRGGYTNASKAFREGASLAEILAGKPGLPDFMVMPYTVSSDPEIASAGMSEEEAKKNGIDIIVATFPFSANGKAVSIGKTVGFVKVVAERSTHRILGFHIVGPRAFDTIDEALLAIEMGARLEDVALTVHPHPALCEALREACAMALGTSVNIIGKER